MFVKIYSKNGIANAVVVASKQRSDTFYSVNYYIQNSILRSKAGTMDFPLNWFPFSLVELIERIHHKIVSLENVSRNISKSIFMMNSLHTIQSTMDVDQTVPFYINSIYLIIIFFFFFSESRTNKLRFHAWWFHASIIRKAMPFVKTLNVFSYQKKYFSPPMLRT